MFARSSLPGSRASRRIRRGSLGGLVFTLTVTLCLPAQAGAEHATQITINTPMAPPAWAVLERELLRANAVACREFFQKYFDDRGYLKCVERWGGDDGPDDAIENLSDWPLLHALGASDAVLEMYKKGWEGHLRQYTQAKTKQVPFARQGMYYKEFPVMFDWLHNGEGLTHRSSPAGARRIRTTPSFRPAFVGLPASISTKTPRPPTTTPRTKSFAACSTAAAGR